MIRSKNIHKFRSNHIQLNKKFNLGDLKKQSSIQDTHINKTPHVLSHSWIKNQRSENITYPKEDKQEQDCCVDDDDAAVEEPRV